MIDHLVKKLAVELAVELQQLTIGPDDVVLLRCGSELRRELHKEFFKILSQLDLPRRRIFWLDPAIAVEIVSGDEAVRIITDRKRGQP